MEQRNKEKEMKITQSMRIFTRQLIEIQAKSKNAFVR
jgi:hypothetical protein